jgi:long-subunit acyl-CoA synthetase (AMP-forming)
MGLSYHNIMSSIGCCLSQFNRTKVIDINSEGNGELCMFGRHVFMGYLNAEQKTKETIDSDGWLHSGDLARIDANNFVYITGRIKELLITGMDYFKNNDLHAYKLS